MKSKVVLAIASSLLVVSLLAGLTACAKAPTTSAAKTLKVGLIECLIWPIGVDGLNGIELDVNKINANGGLDIGGEKYEIDLIVYDNKMDEATSKTSAERLIYQDKVNFIVGDNFCLSYLSLADSNKVVLCATPVSDEIYSPKYQYLFFGSSGDTTWFALIPWLAKRFPDKKTIACAYPDYETGHHYATLTEKAAKAAGLEVLESIFYPPTATDLSAVGTKVKALNPDFFTAYGAGPQNDSLAMKAAYAAGWRGQLFETSCVPSATMAAIAGPEAVEGIITFAWPMEFEPATNKLAQEFKDDYIVEFGEWTNPEVAFIQPWWVLKAGLQQADGPGPDEVAAIISDGMKLECPLGSGVMASRPDFGNNRTVGLVLDSPVKQTVNGKAEQIDFMTVKQAYDFCKLIYGW